ncbi:MAG TPA: hypothetical protein DCZ10_04470 [Pelotomaculum sp.]|nr:hypothetical protein [Pelotomaculum sp.]
MIIEEIYRQLGGTSNPYRDFTFNITSDNTVKLLSTPNLWGHDPTDNSYWAGCPAAPYYLEELTNTIKEAQTIVDISFLWGLPDGYFLKAVKEGLEALAVSGRPVVVRILAGGPPSLENYPLKMEKWLRDLLHLPRLPVYVGVTQSNAHSWNHSKIVAVDGRMAIVGGHNMFNEAYMTFAPVHDVTVKIMGSAAYDAHCFLNRLWLFCSSYSRSTNPLHNYTRLWHNGEIRNEGLPRVEVRPQKGTGSTRTLSLGRMGLGLWQLPDQRANPSDSARWLAVKMAKKTFRLSQQDLGHTVLGFRPYFLSELAGALIRGVHVFAVISGDGATSADGDKYSMLGIRKTASSLKMAVKMHEKGPKDEPALCKLLAERMHLAPLCFTDRRPGKWSGVYKGIKREITPGNHAKVYIVDDNAFYVGSDNAYMHDLQEYGYLIEGDSETRAFLTDYWDKLWLYSGREEFKDWGNVAAAPFEPETDPAEPWSGEEGQHIG